MFTGDSYNEARQERIKIELGRELVSSVYKKRVTDNSLLDFGHVPKAEKTKDKKLALELKRQYKMNQTEAARILELFLITEIENSAILGDGYVFRTTDYDDYCNHVDAVVEQDVDESFTPRLAVDFTTSRIDKVISGKMTRVKRGAHIKYYESESEDLKGNQAEMSLERVPAVVLGFDEKYLDVIAKFAYKNKRKVSKRGEFNQQITEDTIPLPVFKDHPFREVLLKQALIQLDLQINIASATIIKRLLRQKADEPRVLELRQRAEQAADETSMLKSLFDGIDDEELQQLIGVKDVYYWKSLVFFRNSFDKLLSAEQKKEDPPGRKLLLKKFETSFLSKHLLQMDQV